MTDLQIEQIEERLRRAMLASDVEELDQLISERLMWVTPDGAVATKAEDLEAHRSGNMRFRKLEPSERRIERYGDIAIVNVRMSLEVNFFGTEASGDFRITRVWRLDTDPPQIIAGQVGLIAQKS